MTVGEREILFVDPKETDQLIGRVLAGKLIEIFFMEHLRISGYWRINRYLNFIF